MQMLRVRTALQRRRCFLWLVLIVFLGSLTLLVLHSSGYREALVGVAYRTSWSNQVRTALMCAGKTFSSEQEWSDLPRNGTDWDRFKQVARTNPNVSMEQWEKVGSSLYVYSAIYHHILSRLALVIAHNYSDSQLNQLSKSKALSCHVSHELWSSSERVPASIYRTAGPWKDFRSSLWICEVNPSRQLPAYVRVSLTSDIGVVTSPVFPVTYVAARSHMEPSIGVCVKPLHHHYRHPEMIREFIEVLHMFGVQGFLFHVRSITEDVRQLFRTYQRPEHRKRVQVDIMKFVLPLDSNTYFRPGEENVQPGPVNISQYGQMPSMYDCWLRNIYKYKHIWFLDVDEIPFLYTHDTYQSLIEANPDKQVFSFRNTFLPITGKLDEAFASNETVKQLKSVSLLRTMRYNEIFEFFERSKSMVLATALRHPDVHKPQAMEPGIFARRNWKLVDVTEGLSHHYRDAPEMNFTEPRILPHRKALVHRERIIKALRAAQEAGLTV